MRSLLCFLAITILALSSCDLQDRKTKAPQANEISLVGKWHRFTMANGYTEFDIDSEYVVFYNQKVGRFKLPYKIENDSLKYLTNQYAAKVTNYGDSIFLAGNDSTTATLYRFKESNIPFNFIPEEKDSIAFASYQKGFDIRLVSEFRKAGMAISDPTKNPDDTDFQELLKKKNH